MGRGTKERTFCRLQCHLCASKQRKYLFYMVNVLLGRLDENEDDIHVNKSKLPFLQFPDQKPLLAKVLLVYSSKQIAFVHSDKGRDRR